MFAFQLIWFNADILKMFPQNAENWDLDKQEIYLVKINFPLQYTNIQSVFQSAGIKFITLGAY